MPNKSSHASSEDFDIDTPSIPIDYLGTYVGDDFEDEDSLFEVTEAGNTSDRTNPPVKSHKRNGSSWQQIEALNESRHLRALLKEYYED